MPDQIVSLNLTFFSRWDLHAQSRTKHDIDRRHWRARGGQIQTRSDVGDTLRQARVGPGVGRPENGPQHGRVFDSGPAEVFHAYFGAAE
jgi:hypothetical protein